VVNEWRAFMAEVKGEIDQKKMDSDKDGILDEVELVVGTDPYCGDTDGDGIGDGEEVRTRTNPKDRDTDGDGIEDGEEVRLGQNPRQSEGQRDLSFLETERIATTALMLLETEARISHK
jgi:hypothetical protein